MKQLSQEDYRNIKKLCHIAKNLANEAIYNVKQHYFKEKQYLNFYDNCALLKGSVNYRKLNSNMVQHIIKEVDYMFRSFFALLKLKKSCEYSQSIRLPQYLSKDGFTTLIIEMFNIDGDKFTLPYSKSYGRVYKKITVRVPAILEDKKVKVIKIIPKAKARYFEIQYVYEAVKNKGNKITTTH